MTGPELKAIREDLGISQEALARRLGASHSSVSKWESGDRPISRIVEIAVMVQTRGNEDATASEA